VSTESCIAATASDAFAHDLGATLVADATACVDRDLHDHTLGQLRLRFRYDVLDADELLERWRS
jgi:nicotinamidase-related amidase